MWDTNSIHKLTNVQICTQIKFTNTQLQITISLPTKTIHIELWVKPIRYSYLQWKNVKMLTSVKNEKNDIDVNRVSLLCQFHLVDEHTCHESLIETSLVKVLSAVMMTLKKRYFAIMMIIITRISRNMHLKKNWMVDIAEKCLSTTSEFIQGLIF